ncbi:MAG: shikimate dehydrogenase family protein, partial [Solirubrobacteraceae bacterium]
RELAAELGATAAERPGAADLLVNCTAVGLDGSDPFDRLPLDPGDLAGYGCVVDLVYTVAGTVLVDRAREQGVPAVDGLELLIGQGALSFEIFTGVPASTDAMRAAATPGGPGDRATGRRGDRA